MQFLISLQSRVRSFRRDLIAGAAKKAFDFPAEQFHAGYDDNSDKRDDEDILNHSLAFATFHETELHNSPP
jgi:hypothetical protein